MLMTTRRIRERISGALSFLINFSGVFMNNDSQYNDKENREREWVVGKPNVFNSRWNFIFALIVFLYLSILNNDIDLLVRLSMVIITWWISLFVFWVFPVFSNYDAERKWIKRHNESAVYTAKKTFVSIVFLFAYWPIFLHKEIAFWTIFFLVVANYFFKYFWG